MLIETSGHVTNYRSALVLHMTLLFCVCAGVMGAAIDFGVTQVVDANVGVHSIIPK